MTPQKRAPRKAVAPKGATAEPKGATAEPKAFSDTLLDEVAASLGDDAPKMLALHQVTKDRRKRADMMRSVHDMDPLLQRLQAAEDAGGIDSADPDMFEMLADIEDFLRTFAADPARFEAWIAKPAGDDELLALFARFVRDLNPGEASSSST